MHIANRRKYDALSLYFYLPLHTPKYHWNFLGLCGLLNSAQICMSLFSAVTEMLLTSLVIYIGNFMHHIMQVFISYGKKSNGELLLSYGFVPREGTNPNDSVELPLSLNKSDKCYEEKLEALRKHGLSAWVSDRSLFDLLWFIVVPELFIYHMIPYVMECYHVLTWVNQKA